MKACANTVFDAWTGAIVRNNLLYAADKVRVNEYSCSLRELIDKLPLPTTHTLYNELKEGFPKGYVLSDFSHFDLESNEIHIPKGTVFSFSLTLIGNFNRYSSYFFEAIRQMCKRGIGKPLTTFDLLDISEVNSAYLGDFLEIKQPNELSKLTIRYKTPMILFRLKNKKNAHLSYQDKGNRFPALYQLVRSAFFRMQKLYAIYAKPDEDCSFLSNEQVIEDFLKEAGYTLLLSTNIYHITLNNTLKKEKVNEMPLAGYVGEQVYSGNCSKYLPLLQFMANLGVGNEVVYGMGEYSIEGQQKRNRIDENQKNEVENECRVLDSFIGRQEAGFDENKHFEIVRLSRLTVRFKNEISLKDIPFLIEAIAEKTTKSNDSLHRHIVGNGEYVYPVIQFKRVSKQAVAVCVGEGIESVGGFFSSANGQVFIGDKEIDLEIESVKAENIIVQVWENNFSYNIRKYLPLSNENYIEYQSIDNENIRRKFIENILQANILFFANSFDIQLNKDIACLVTELEEKSKVKYKNHTFLSFDLKFKTNVSLPNYIGLGIGVSSGFGTVVKMSNE